jgi:hypothetical protein
MWLIRAVAKDDTGLVGDKEMVGIVGSITFCMFHKHLHERPAEDVYALYAARELAQDGLAVFDPASGGPPDRVLLAAHAVSELTAMLSDLALDGEVKCSARVRPLAQRVHVMSAKRAGREGWLIVDGESPFWYPAAEQPPETAGCDVGELHVGRHYLGFSDQPDRKRFLRLPYQLSDAELIVRYERALAAAREAPSNDQDERFSSFGPLGQQLHDYVAALLRAGRHQGVETLLEMLSPHWAHNMGYAELGKAAHGAGLFERAEQLFEQLLVGYEHAYRSEAMGAPRRHLEAEGRRKRRSPCSWTP